MRGSTCDGHSGRSFQTSRITVDNVEEHSDFTAELNDVLSIRQRFNFVVDELLVLWLILSPYQLNICS
jgi:hypothetical protein